METYCKRLKELREDNDLSQKAIANILNIRYNVYQRYEYGVSKLPVHILEALANYYKTSTDYILCRTDIYKPYPKK